MARVALGRAEALEALYDRYAGVAFSLALRVLSDRGAAEEVVQDAFVSVWRRAETFDAAQGRLYSWLLRIVRNRAIDELRRRRALSRDDAMTRGMERDAVDPTPGPADLEADASRAAELRVIVGGALEGLPGEQREVLEMAYLQGLSQREISDKTGIPLGTVKTRTRLALRKLRDTLAPLGERLDLDGA